MNSEIEMSNSNLEMEKDNFKYILGNIFFTSVLTLLSFIRDDLVSFFMSFFWNFNRIKIP